MIGVLLIIFPLMTACRNKGESKLDENLRVFGESEAVKMLENYNKDYKLANELRKLTVVRVLGDVDINFDMVNNYISHVNGRIVEKETIKDEEFNTNAVLYTLEIPIDAKYSSELEDLFFGYSFYDYYYRDGLRFKNIFYMSFGNFNRLGEKLRKMAEEY